MAVDEARVLDTGNPRTRSDRGQLNLRIKGIEEVDFVPTDPVLREELGLPAHQKPLPIEIADQGKGGPLHSPMGEYYKGYLSGQDITCLKVTPINVVLVVRELSFLKTLRGLSAVTPSCSSKAEAANLPHESILFMEQTTLAEDVSSPRHFICYPPVSTTLASWARKGGARGGHTPKSVIMDIFRGICKGLVYLHDEDIVHCALTPSSVFLAQTEENKYVPKISNFGRAMKLEQRGIYAAIKNALLPMFGRFAGTPTALKTTPTPTSAATPGMVDNSWILDASYSPYMSPESMSKQFTDKHDIFSLGSIMYEVLTGKTPKRALSASDDCQETEHYLDSVISNCTCFTKEVRLTASELLEMLKEEIIDTPYPSLDSEVFVTPPTSLENDRSPSVREPFQLQQPYKDISVIVPFKEPLTSCLKNGLLEAQNYEHVPHELISGSALFKKEIFYDIGDTSHTLVGIQSNRIVACFEKRTFKSVNFDSLVSGQMSLQKVKHNHLLDCFGMHRVISEGTECISIYEECTTCSIKDFFHHQQTTCLTKTNRVWLINSITKQLLQLVHDLQYKGICVAAHKSINSTNVRLQISSQYQDTDCCKQKSFKFHKVKLSLSCPEDDRRYRPPEYPNIDEGSDIWSVFCITVFMLSGKHPWDDRKQLPQHNDVESFDPQRHFGSLVNLEDINQFWTSYLYKDAILQVLREVFVAEPVNRPSSRDIMDKYFESCSAIGGIHEYVILKSQLSMESHFVEHIQVTINKIRRVDIDQQHPLSTTSTTFKSLSPESLPVKERENFYCISSKSGPELLVPKSVLRSRVLHGLEVTFSLAVAFAHQEHASPTGKLISPVLHFDSPLHGMNKDHVFICHLLSFGTPCEKCILPIDISSYRCEDQVDQYASENFRIISRLRGKMTFALLKSSVLGGFVSPDPCSSCSLYQFNVEILRERRDPSNLHLCVHIDNGVWKEVLRHRFPEDTYDWYMVSPESYHLLSQYWNAITVDSTLPDSNIQCTSGNKIKCDTLVNIDHNSIVESCHNGNYPPAIAMVIQNIYKETVVKIDIELAPDKENMTVEHRFAPLPSVSQLIQCHQPTSPPTDASPPHPTNPFLDRIPSDIGLQLILEEIPLWLDFAVKLGVPIDTVKAQYQLQHQQMGGLCALKMWRDGKYYATVDNTWHSLLQIVVEHSGPRPREKLLKRIKECHCESTTINAGALTNNYYPTSL